MFRDTRTTNPNRMLSLGLIFLAAAGIGSYVIRRKLALPESVADPLTGFLYGVAIATTLLGIRLRARSLSNRAQ